MLLGRPVFNHAAGGRVDDSDGSLRCSSVTAVMVGITVAVAVGVAVSATGARSEGSRSFPSWSDVSTDMD